MEIASYTNSENEKISIKRIDNPFNKFVGATLLVIHDDPKTGIGNTVAPHLLDTGTIDFLLKELTKLKERNTK